MRIRSVQKTRTSRVLLKYWTQVRNTQYSQPRSTKISGPLLTYNTDYLFFRNFFVGNLSRIVPVSSNSSKKIRVADPQNLVIFSFLATENFKKIFLFLFSKSLSYENFS